MITLGSDVEMAVVNEDGILTDVTGLIGGTKKKPLWFDNYNLQEDNVNVEYAINPCETLEQWQCYHAEAKRGVIETLPIDFDVRVEASNMYPDSSLVSTESKIFGCDLDFSAWTGGSPIHKPPPEHIGNFRTCGGHIHIGSENLDVHGVVKWMDILLGLPSLFMDSDYDRRKLYGQAGSFRPKSYGVEYRALSNFWVKDKEGIEWAWKQTMKAIEFSYTDMLQAIPDLTSIPEAIDTYNYNSADKSLTWLSKEGLL